MQENKLESESRNLGRRTGRKLKLTDEVANRVLDAIALGATHKTACRAAGIGTSTFYSWLQKGLQGESGPFLEFRDAVHMVEAKRECEALACIYEAEKADWRAAAWFLSRRHPERWGRGRTRLRSRSAETEPGINLSSESVALGEALAADLERIRSTFPVGTGETD